MSAHDQRLGAHDTDVRNMTGNAADGPAQRGYATLGEVADKIAELVVERLAKKNERATVMEIPQHLKCSIRGGEHVPYNRDLPQTHCLNCGSAVRYVYGADRGFWETLIVENNPAPTATATLHDGEPESLPRINTARLIYQDRTKDWHAVALRLAGALRANITRLVEVGAHDFACRTTYDESRGPCDCGMPAHIALLRDTLRAEGM
jgi:hypothetical protein